MHNAGGELPRNSVRRSWVRTRTEAIRYSKSVSTHADSPSTISASRGPNSWGHELATRILLPSSFGPGLRRALAFILPGFLTGSELPHPALYRALALGFAPPRCSKPSLARALQRLESLFLSSRKSVFIAALMQHPRGCNTLAPFLGREYVKQRLSALLVSAFLSRERSRTRCPPPSFLAVVHTKQADASFQACGS